MIGDEVNLRLDIGLSFLLRIDKLRRRRRH
jgi:hypothetical protein